MVICVIREKIRMKYRNLGKSGMKVSVIGLGCMGMTHAYGAPSDEDEMIRLIHSAFEMGITFFDTAECYVGKNREDRAVYNESLVGKALKPFRDKVVIASKFGVHHNPDGTLLTDSRPETIRKSVEGSLRRLGTDHIDLYYQHRIDPDVEPEEVASVMRNLIEEGKIRAWGVSEARMDYICRADKICRITAVQNRFSMMYRDYEDMLPELEAMEIAFVAHSPLANGFLSGRYDKTSQFDKQYDYRSSMPQFRAESIDKNSELLRLLKELSELKRATPAQVSLAWLMAKGIIPIPGTRLSENTGAADVELTSEEVSDIDRALGNMEMSEVFGGHKAS